MHGAVNIIFKVVHSLGTLGGLVYNQKKYESNRRRKVQNFEENEL